MNHRPRLSLVVLLALFASTPLQAQHMGGHFGGSGFSGHSFGHAAGHSFGHMFGHRSGGRNSQNGKGPRGHADEPPLAGAAFIHGKVVQLPGPVGTITSNRQPTHPAPVAFTPGPRPRSVLHPHRQFNSGFCASFGFSWHTFLFPGDFNCFGAPFLFDPFFSGGFIAGRFASNGFIAAGDLSAVSWPLDSFPAANPADEPSVVSSPVPGEDKESFPDAPATAEPPIILLQLTDGSMYGLTRYWVEDGRLYYVTTYGGENSVPLDRVDFPKTVQLNADRNIPLVLPGAPSVP
jgi:hypothetical protein